MISSSLAADENSASKILASAAAEYENYAGLLGNSEEKEEEAFENVVEEEVFENASGGVVEEEVSVCFNEKFVVLEVVVEGCMYFVEVVEVFLN